MNDFDTISQILANTRTIAVVGLSSSPARAGHYVPAYMQDNGYCILPVNPNLQEALGEKAYPDLHTIPEQVDLVLVFHRPEHVPAIVQQAIEIKARGGLDAIGDRAWPGG